MCARSTCKSIRTGASSASSRARLFRASASSISKRSAASSAARRKPADGRRPQRLVALAARRPRQGRRPPAARRRRSGVHSGRILVAPTAATSSQSANPACRRARRASRAAVRHLARERVLERELALPFERRAGRRRMKSRCSRTAKSGSSAHQLTDRARPERPADDGGSLQRGLLVAGRSVDPRREHGLNGVGQADRAADARRPSRRRPARRSRSAWRPAPRERADCPPPARAPRGRLWAPRPHRCRRASGRPRRRLNGSSQIHSPGTRPRPQVGVRSRSSCLPVASNRTGPRPRPAFARAVREGLLRPVEILDEEHQRLLGGELRD